MHNKDLASGTMSSAGSFLLAVLSMLSMFFFSQDLQTCSSNLALSTPSGALAKKGHVPLRQQTQGGRAMKQDSWQDKLRIIVSGTHVALVTSPTTRTGALRAHALREVYGDKVEKGQRELQGDFSFPLKRMGTADSFMKRKLQPNVLHTRERRSWSWSYAIAKTAIPCIRVPFLKQILMQAENWQHSDIKCVDLQHALAFAGRAEDVIQIGHRVATLKKLDVQKTYVDVSQSADRRAIAQGLRVLTTKCCVFSYGKQRTLSGWEHLRAHGMPSLPLPPDTPESTLKDLAGESMGAPVCGNGFASSVVCSSSPFVLDEDVGLCWSQNSLSQP